MKANFFIALTVTLMFMVCMFLFYIFRQSVVREKQRAQEVGRLQEAMTHLMDQTGEKTKQEVSSEKMYNALTPSTNYLQTDTQTD